MSQERWKGRSVFRPLCLVLLLLPLAGTARAEKPLLEGIEVAVLPDRGMIVVQGRSPLPDGHPIYLSLLGEGGRAIRTSSTRVRNERFVGVFRQEDLAAGRWQIDVSTWPPEHLAARTTGERVVTTVPFESGSTEMATRAREDARVQHVEQFGLLRKAFEAAEACLEAEAGSDTERSSLDKFTRQMQEVYPLRQETLQAARDVLEGTVQDFFPTATNHTNVILHRLHALHHALARKHGASPPPRPPGWPEPAGSEEESDGMTGGTEAPPLEQVPPSIAGGANSEALYHDAVIELLFTEALDEIGEIERADSIALERDLRRILDLHERLETMVARHADSFDPEAWNRASEEWTRATDDFAGWHLKYAQGPLSAAEHADLGPNGAELTARLVDLWACRHLALHAAAGAAGGTERAEAFDPYLDWAADRDLPPDPETAETRYREAFEQVADVVRVRRIALADRLTAWLRELRELQEGVAGGMPASSVRERIESLREETLDAIDREFRGYARDAWFRMQLALRSIQAEGGFPSGSDAGRAIEGPLAKTTVYLEERIRALREDPFDTPRAGDGE